MKVCLINPQYTFDKSARSFIPSYAPELPYGYLPLGIAYIASYLEKEGHSVSVIDCTGESNEVSFNGEAGEVGLSTQRVKERIMRLKPDMVGITCFFSSRFPKVLEIARAVKSVDADIPVVIGGAGATVASYEVLAESAIDFAVLGEGEETMLDLANGRPPSEIDGLGYKEDGGIRINPKTRYIENLDSIPFPAWHLFNPNYFIERKVGLWRRFYMVNVVTSRGCPNRCTFCAAHVQWGGRWRARSPENVVEELKQLKEVYGVKHIDFADDNLTVNRKRTVDLCNLMIKEKLDVTWVIGNGVSVISLDRELLALMKKAGCNKVTLAIESGDPYILKRSIRKPLTLRKARQVANDCKALGIWAHSFWVVGMIEDTPATLRNSLEFLKSIPLDGIEVATAKPLPATRLYEDAVKGGYLDRSNYSKFLSFDRLADLPLMNTPWLKGEEAIAWKKQFYLEFQKSSFRRLIKYAFHRVRRAAMHYPEVWKM